VNQVPGERHEPVVSHAISMQSRASRALALGLIGVLGVGILVWYYSNALARETRVPIQRKRRSAGERRARWSCHHWDASIRRRLCRRPR